MPHSHDFFIFLFNAFSISSKSSSCSGSGHTILVSDIISLRISENFSFSSFVNSVIFIISFFFRAAYAIDILLYMHQYYLNLVTIDNLGNIYIQRMLSIVYMKDESETTHKRISYKNIERVKRIGNFGDSFNDVIGRLLDFWESEHENTKAEIKIRDEEQEN